MLQDAPSQEPSDLAPQMDSRPILVPTRVGSGGLAAQGSSWEILLTSTPWTHSLTPALGSHEKRHVCPTMAHCSTSCCYKASSEKRKNIYIFLKPAFIGIQQTIIM